MTVNDHRVADPPVPGGTRQEYIQGSLTLATGTATETISLNLDYTNKPVITGAAGAGTTGEDVALSLLDDDPTSDGDIQIQLDGATDEAKEYHVVVTSPIAENS